MNLSLVLSTYYNDRFGYYECPVCTNDTLEPGEYVEYFKATPDQCNVCGYRESNGTEAYPDTSEFIRHCWELQVAPYRALIN